MRIPSSLLSPLFIIPTLLGCSSAPTMQAAEQPHDGSLAVCTEIGCVDGLTIDLSQLSWEPGSYQIDVAADGDITRCQVTLPLPPCSNPGTSCDGTGVQVGESGCALAPSAHSLTELRLVSLPDNVEVTVTRDGAPFASRRFTPNYQVSRPNGPRCEPECKSANELLAP
ncbi:MAG: hypothetical protein KIT72_00655 [Polyangiaceae bacterium]|nr:hypothetical protein [Polyangiaceae bacterium]MCW5788907.1 hypothetical protein [Polyangiaceae bacterium]